MTTTTLPTYTPRNGSLAQRLIKHLRAEPDREMTIAETAARFCVEYHSVDKGLRDAIKARLIIKVRKESGRVVYRLPDLITEGAPA